MLKWTAKRAWIGSRLTANGNLEWNVARPGDRFQPSILGG
jgi:hypothetical protein